METMVVWEAKRDNLVGTQESMAFVAMRWTQMDW